MRTTFFCFSWNLIGATCRWRTLSARIPKYMNLREANLAHQLALANLNAEELQKRASGQIGGDSA